MRVQRVVTCSREAMRTFAVELRITKAHNVPRAFVAEKAPRNHPQHQGGAAQGARRTATNWLIAGRSWRQAAGEPSAAHQQWTPVACKWSVQATQRYTTGLTLD